VLFDFGTFLVELTETKTGIFIFGASQGLIAAGVVLGATYALQRAHVAEPKFGAAFCVGLTMAVLGWLEAAATRNRRLRVFADVSRVAELNHHVRNALQAIQYATQMPAGIEQMRIIEDGVKRIDETLRHLFPAVAIQAKAKAKTPRTL
jgi:hypothetical protein